VNEVTTSIAVISVGSSMNEEFEEDIVALLDR